jgi:hypothetical protein
LAEAAPPAGNAREQAGARLVKEDFQVEEEPEELEGLEGALAEEALEEEAVKVDPVDWAVELVVEEELKAGARVLPNRRP